MTQAIHNDIERDLGDVRKLMVDSLTDTVLHRLSPDYKNILGNGKMLRSRLVFRVGPAARAPHKTLLHSAAAVEMIHAASLLHDDVIDGGILRRSAPTFWVERGISGAILVGDLMLFKALNLMCQVEDGRLVQTLVRTTGEVCDAESEQELFLRGAVPNWENCVSIARRKTGALFAFAAYACGGNDPVLCATLLESGYAVGTAYQLADDILDVSNDEVLAGKTLGTDEARDKITAASAARLDQIDTAAYIDSLCVQAENTLEGWPRIQDAWRTFMNHDLRPTLRKNLAGSSRDVAQTGTHR